jgi:leucyl aminopeptidase
MDIQTHTHAPQQDDFDRISHWLVVFNHWHDDSAYGKLLHQRWLRRGKAEKKPIVLDLPNAIGTRVVLWYGAITEGCFGYLTQGRQMYALLKDDRPQRLGIFMPDADAVQIEAIVEAVLAATAVLPCFKRDNAPMQSLLVMSLFATDLECSRARAVHEGAHLARSLALLPGNYLPPSAYRQRLESLATTHGWAYRCYDEAELQRLGAGAFLAVSQGGGTGACIVHLRYTPPRLSQYHVALIGKGLCFDSGGLQLKSATSIQNMHHDMQGSAVALGTLLALTLLRCDLTLDCWLALAENHLSPNAMKPQDVVTALNGDTIELIHTDAEGRLVLADTLTLAARQQPDVMIDYATLTGSCITALGTRYSGIFCNRPAWLNELVAIGRASGERVWPFPLDADYDEELHSDIADIKQCLPGSEADHIFAARFLQRFVADHAWLHLDLSASYHEKGLAHIPGAVTGFGVRYSVYLLLDSLEYLHSLET